ncbi:MAG: hypothetical protein WCJ41_20345 [Aestuariivirga sp.]|uniref:hypothetical protein n=1 Tax=Aestuariivirga sp. TaxID=2650926 RepID=UPI003015D9B8
MTLPVTIGDCRFPAKRNTMALLSFINFVVILAITIFACWFIYRRLVKGGTEKQKAILITGVPFAVFWLLIFSGAL